MSQQHTGKTGALYSQSYKKYKHNAKSAVKAVDGKRNTTNWLGMNMYHYQVSVLGRYQPCFKVLLLVMPLIGSQ